jgi:hypothetical protein
MLTFVRNRATNILALVLGLFFKIGGTSSRVIDILSNAGVCVAFDTIERLKVVVSNDAVQRAVGLLAGGDPCYVIFDNINLYLRKSQQRVFNKNSMLNVTNAAVIGLTNVDPNFTNLKAKLDLRGKRINATVEDILPTSADEDHLMASFTASIAQFLVSYTPGNDKWNGRKEMAKAVAAMMPQDRPLPPEKSNACPFGVFDVDEGAKKGIIKLFKAMQERSGMSEEQWAGKNRIMEGDWLSSNNTRAAKRDRANDIDTMERLDYVDELSALWHFALNATHMIMRTHLGNAVLDPTGLAAHKGMLHRVWDVNKPNYAEAKSLIRHSLIARILHCVMFAILFSAPLSFND